MRILILGHSDSSGRELTDRALAWPWLVGDRLKLASGEDVEIDHREFNPLRPGTTDFVARLVTETEPDIVCVAVNPFWFAGATVSLRVRQRFGPDAARRYLRLESAFDRGTRSGRIKRPFNRAVRRITRRVVGTAVPGSLTQVRDAYEAVLTRLSQFEDTPILVLAGNRLPERTARNPALRRQVDDFIADMERTVERHRFDWFDTETTFGEVDRSAQLFADGIHRNELGHQRHADCIYPLFSRLAEVGEPVTAGDA